MKAALILALLSSLLFAQDSKPLRDFSEDSPVEPAKAAQVPSATSPLPATPTAASLSAKESEMRAIAERFSPILYQRTAGTAEQRRFDYPTIFDFDGDWIGNNNWENAADPKLKIWSYVYYSVIESDDYYFLHYAFYHPRDWSTVQDRYDGVLDQLQVKYKGMVGDSMRKEAEFNHENDLEGVLIIVEKHASGGPQPVAIETIAHGHRPRALVENTDLSVTTGTSTAMRVEDGHTLLYIESQKHGVHAYTNEQSTSDEPIIRMTCGKTTEWSQVKDDAATYELVPIFKTFWKHARETHQRSTTFGTVLDFGSTFCDVAGARRPDCEIGTVGAALRGDHLRPDSALTPWAWGDSEDPTFPAGAWFFDPIVVVQRHFDRADVRNTYLYNPYLGIGVESLAPVKPASAVATSTPAQPALPTPAAPELKAPVPSTSTTPAPAASATSVPVPAPGQKPIRDFSEPDEKK
jgi:hypothetical protein